MTEVAESKGEYSQDAESYKKQNTEGIKQCSRGVEDFVLHHPIEAQQSPNSNSDPVESNLTGMATAISAENGANPMTSSTEHQDIDNRWPLQEQSFQIRSRVANVIVEEMPEVIEQKKRLQMQVLRNAMEIEHLEHTIKRIQLQIQLSGLENSRPLQEVARDSDLERMFNQSPQELIEKLYAQRIRHRIIEEEIEHKIRVVQLQTQLMQLCN